MHYSELPKLPFPELERPVMAAIVNTSDEKLRALFRRAYETERRTKQLIETTEELLRQARASREADVHPRE
jgi:peptide subunit release factor 1 (eRF1)